MPAAHLSAVDAEEQALLESGTDLDMPVDEPEHKQLAFSFAKRHQVLLDTGENPAILYHTQDTEFQIFAEVRRFLGAEFRLKEVELDKFETILTRAFQRDSSAAKQLMEDIGNESDLFSLAEDLPNTEDLLESEDDAPIIKLINAMLGEAIKEGASDIHIETFETQLLVRFRVDGVLREILRPNRKMASMLVSRIKVMSKMDIAEKRVPQDGRITLRIAGRAVDVRVSTMPSSHGERVVLRLLDKNNVRLNLQDLGMTKTNRGVFSKLVRKPHGIILVTGPTGSGKSTTLYAGLSEINSKDRNILTVEDPIEFVHSNIRSIVHQRELHSDVPDFASAVKAALREDPDIIMIGEMRDLDTMRTALTAAETGHLVFSTLHTNDAVGVVERLIGSFPGNEQAVARQRIAHALKAVIAQNLLPTLSGDGRAVVAEILMVTTAVANLIESAKSKQIYSVMESSTRQGMQTLDQALARLVAQRTISHELGKALSRDSTSFDSLVRGA